MSTAAPPPPPSRPPSKFACRWRVGRSAVDCQQLTAPSWVNPFVPTISSALATSRNELKHGGHGDPRSVHGESNDPLHLPAVPVDIPNRWSPARNRPLRGFSVFLRVPRVSRRQRRSPITIDRLHVVDARSAIRQMLTVDRCLPQRELEAFQHRDVVAVCEHQSLHQQSFIQIF